jgi:two-component system response regulator PilR (NtrC family)
MSPAMQVKLLRVLQERRFRRVGGTEEVPADIRVVTASNRDLARAVAEGRFREDLYYRINVIPVVLPSLRERREDIPLLAAHFVQRFATQMGKGITGISGDALRCLERHAWPGNVRELENAMERAVALEQTPAVLPESLPDAVRGSAAPALRLVQPPGGDDSTLPDTGFSLEQHVESIERAYIAQALARAHGVKTRAAELLGMSFRSFRYYTKKYGIR